MAFTGKEGASISVEEAQAMISRYRTKFETQDGSDTPSITRSVFSGREIIQTILDQKECVGIRFYFSERDGYQDLVMIGVDKDENDLVKGVIADRTKPCPPSCSTGAVQLVTS